MLPVHLTIERRSWNPFRRRRFVLQLPETWAEVQPERRRIRWWRWTMTLPQPGAQRAMVRDLIPRRFRRLLTDMDMAALAAQLSWTHAEAQCEQVPVPRFEHNGGVYVFPSSKGANVTGVEFALCDDLYKQFADGDLDALPVLSAAIWRQEDWDGKAALRRGDARVPLVSKEEAEERARWLQKAPPEMHAQALLWFAGLKLYIHRVYGKWIFEEQEEDDEAETQQPATNNQSPNFGWWGVFLEVAEAGVFGSLDKVYQTSIHDICIYLVKKRVDAEATRSNYTAPRTTEAEED